MRKFSPITRLTLEGFQAHETRDITLGPVTTLVGDNDVGKSSVVRALRWLCLNRPRGKGFVRRGCKECKVTARLEGGKRVARLRTGERNAYLVNKKALEAVSGGVPDSVQALLGCGEENFQRQHDPLFWFGLNPGELSREINAIVDLTLIDGVLSFLAAEVRKAKAEGGVCQDRLAKAETEVESLAWAEEADRDLAALEAAERDMAAIVTKCARIRGLVGGLGEVARKARDAAEGGVCAAKAMSAWEAAREVGERAERLAGLLESGGDLCRRVREATRAAEDCERKLARETNCPLCGSPLVSEGGHNE